MYAASQIGVSEAQPPNHPRCFASPSARNAALAPRSCWAFATTEALESHVAIQTGSLLTFSPQEWVDCAANPDECGGTGGCAGATAEIGFTAAQQWGITSEASYPYQGVTQSCDEASIAPVANITGRCVVSFGRVLLLLLLFLLVFALHCRTARVCLCPRSFFTA